MLNHFPVSKPRKSTLLVRFIIDFVGTAIFIILKETIYLDALSFLIIYSLIWHFYNPALTVKISYGRYKIALLKDTRKETAQQYVHWNDADSALNFPKDNNYLPISYYFYYYWVFSPVKLFSPIKLLVCSYIKSITKKKDFLFSKDIHFHVILDPHY